ncbi:thiolase [Faunimonas sp. B44]|uniref:thiolase n=1 Tax=Faunimonas sp. B44 TaxID=3461493 RepID=UPI004044DC6D
MTSAHPLRGAAAIVGVGSAGCGDATGRTEIEITVEACRKAVADAGLRMSDIDGLVTASMTSPMPSLRITQELGLDTTFVDATCVGGSSFLLHLLIGAMALQNGLCSAVLVCYGSTQRSGIRRSTISAYREAVDPDPYELPYRPFNPPTAYALAAARHMHEFGTTRAQLAEVAVAARRWAGLNPEAFARDPISIEDVLSARRVSDPLGVRDCCLVTDGAGAIVLVRSDRAKDMPQPPAFVLGVGAAHTHRQISSMPDLTTTGARRSGERAYAMAGLGPGDVDVLQLYDAFTINVVLFLEDLGFCRKGEGGAFVEGGRIGPGGALPVNTNGGGLSCVHPGMYGMFLLIEAVRQLRGEAGPRQVDGVETVLCHGNGSVLSSQVTAILGGRSALS